MKKWLYLVVAPLVLAASVPALAVKPVLNAVNIEINTDGRGVDNTVIKKVRRLSGDALALGTIDNFIVNAPKVGGPILREGGLSACAEIGFSARRSVFNRFVKKLTLIKPKVGTFIHVNATDNCVKPTPQMCGGIAAIACPTGKSCVDDPSDSCDPTNGGADCSGICQ